MLRDLKSWMPVIFFKFDLDIYSSKCNFWLIGGLPQINNLYQKQIGFHLVDEL